MTEIVKPETTPILCLKYPYLDRRWAKTVLRQDGIRGEKVEHRF